MQANLLVINKVNKEQLKIHQWKRKGKAPALIAGNRSKLVGGEAFL